MHWVGGGGWLGLEKKKNKPGVTEICHSSAELHAAIVRSLSHHTTFVCGVPVKINEGPKATISEGAREENQNECCAI